MSRGLGDVYKRQVYGSLAEVSVKVDRGLKYEENLIKCIVSINGFIEKGLSEKHNFPIAPFCNSLSLEFS